MNFEDFKLYLPKFLSEQSQKELFQSLDQFPDNIDDRIYTDKLKNDNMIFQGDGIKQMQVINLPNHKIGEASCLILSNTCDIDDKNKRYFDSKIVYSPIIKLNKYKKMLKAKLNKSDKQIDDHISAIKKQRITQIFYLPEKNNVIEDSMVFLDRLCNVSSNYIDKNTIENQRLFSLGNYGLYLFIIKLSIHFTRLQDRVDRG